MTPQEVNALLTYTATMDNLVSDSEATLDLWAYTLGGVELAQAQYVVRDYYARQQPNQRQPITPAYIRSKVAQESSRAAARRAALESKPVRSHEQNLSTWRARNPEEWDRLVVQGIHDQWEQWARRGETDQACRCGCGGRP